MKTKEEILDQLYISPQDLKMLIPKLGINKCTEYIKDVRLEMQDKGYFVPQSRPLLALTKIVKKRCGF